MKLFLLSFLLSISLLTASDEAGVAYFDQHIHPLLESKCYQCHGVEKVSGNLVLTNRNALLSGGQRGPAVDLTDPASSVLLQMVNQSDPKQRMPLESHPLSEQEKGHLQEWIAMGAPYNPEREFDSELAAGMTIDDEARRYWAYQPPTKPTPPKAAGGWAKNAIDQFILAGLREAGLTPNPPAPSNHLLRRVHYDLTGLAPPQEELAAAHLDEAAWRAKVDELLDSPHFGEKMATLWLDLVRYAESNGFERDSEKPYLWRYRDYVIQSFNENKPYHQFVLEQLAGDEIPEPTFDSVIATGFMTLMQRDDEPADPPQAHADTVSDIVDVAAEAFMATTMACCKCHDHKGDPLRQADYFSMMAFFDGIRPDLFKTPTKEWLNPESEQNRKQKLAQVTSKLDDLRAQHDLSPLAGYLSPKPNPRLLIPLSQSNRQTWQVSSHVPRDPTWTLPGFRSKAFQEKLAPFAADIGKRPVQPASAWTQEVLVLRKEFGLTELPDQLLFYASGSKVENLKLSFNGNLFFDGVPARNQGRYLLPLGNQERQHLTTGRNALAIVVTSSSERGKWFDAGLAFDPLDALTAEDLVTLKPDLVAESVSPAFLTKARALVERKLTLLKPLKGEHYLTIQEEPTIPPAKIHIRGNVHAEGKEVPLAFPAVMVPDEDAARPPIPADFFAQNQTHGRRLAFATWLTQPDHPLTARVMVNRLWQHLFGVGIVATSNDFGRFGEGVSNQDLLDWLAVEFVESGWSVKHILRLMLTSATYRQSVQGNELALESDATNKLHWRHNPRRLTAEEVRDTFLSLTGELNLAAGGPPVRPRMPAEVLATASRPDHIWPETKGPAANKRTIYLHAKRSIKLPLLSAFDSPERDISCASRFATTVPTQALTLLNSEFVNQTAAKFADRIRQRLPQSPFAEQVAAAYQSALGREIQGAELAELIRLSEDLHSDHQVPEQELLSNLCLLILNLNETLYLD